MPLINYKPLTDEVKIGVDGANGTLVVRAIGFPEVSQLIDVHAASISPLFDQATGKSKDKKLTMADVDRIPMELMAKAPAAVAHLIALAADEPANVIASLPLDVQFEALIKIGKLTFKSVGGAANFLEMVAGAFASVTALATENKEVLQRSLNGMKDSSETVPS